MAGKKPATPVMTGNANIPAPIQLPAMRRIPPRTLPDLDFMQRAYHALLIYSREASVRPKGIKFKRKERNKMKKTGYLDGQD